MEVRPCADCSVPGQAVQWCPAFSAWLCPACREIRSARELMSTPGCWPRAPGDMSGRLPDDYWDMNGAHLAAGGLIGWSAPAPVREPETLCVSHGRAIPCPGCQRLEPDNLAAAVRDMALAVARNQCCHVRGQLQGLGAAQSDEIIAFEESRATVLAAEYTRDILAGRGIGGWSSDDIMSGVLECAAGQPWTIGLPDITSGRFRWAYQSEPHAGDAPPGRLVPFRDARVTRMLEHPELMRDQLRMQQFSGDWVIEPDEVDSRLAEAADLLGERMSGEEFWRGFN